MAGERLKEHANPRAANGVVRGAAELYCSICNTKPCYLLSTASLAVMQEQLNCDRNLIGAIRYVKALNQLRACLERHAEVTRDEYGLDQHLRVSDEALEYLQGTGTDVDELKRSLAEEED